MAVEAGQGEVAVLLRVLFFIQVSRVVRDYSTLSPDNKRKANISPQTKHIYLVLLPLLVAPEKVPLQANLPRGEGPVGEGGHGDVEEEGGQHDDGPEGDRTGLAVGLGVIGAGDLEFNIFVKWKCVSFFHSLPA